MRCGQTDTKFNTSRRGECAVCNRCNTIVGLDLQHQGPRVTTLQKKQKLVVANFKTTTIMFKMNDEALNGSNGDAGRPGASEIDPAILAELTRALLPYLGPYSITTVKRASRTTTDINETLRVVAQHIDDLNKRELFIKSAKRILKDLRPLQQVQAASARTPQVNTGGRPATPITPELMTRGEAALAPIIGPLANVLVQRNARASENSRDFFERLAGHLRSSDERDTFFANIRDSGGAFGAQV